MAEKPFIVFVLGPPASGKGTLCKRLADAHKQYLYHLSVGDYLRYLINGPLSDQADIIDSVRSGGTRGLVRGDVIVSLLLDKINEEMGKGKSVFLLDGFPRNLEQDEAFKALMNTEFNRGTPDLTISISCPRETARARYLNRKRGDDSEELFDKRYSDYEGRDRKVVELYQKNLVEVRAVEGRSIDQSFQEMTEALYRTPAWKAMMSKA
ncbi:P-loop containing nucleoside triphosphate hydrolase protein [Mollisia scopiformis]|uniref:p-loop containing nucleoside triphosphate hydrolase protein n=1 Tax=Mollisia scopiformis TaxID=149040 RepID=A0A194WV97_MOLSC|nr:P-loop containing nucleoside triphosphate hydrolase protein [Mollisia scopiformis]KUJ11893.1 P-loop containing nucleoside triphosphate hydrolase protein [Mollisia scopiformis]